MSESTRNAVMLGLAVLHEFADTAGKKPLPPSLELRALLALLHALGDGRRDPFVAFWKHALSHDTVDRHASASGYIRSTMMRVEILGIGSSLQLDLRAMELSDAIAHLRARHRKIPPFA